jgi:hypothetical protein
MEQTMGQLTVEERRRVFLAREQHLHKPLVLPPGRLVGPGRERTADAAARRRRNLTTIAIIVTLLATGSVAWGTVEFRRPLSVLETVLPRA